MLTLFNFDVDENCKMFINQERNVLQAQVRRRACNQFESKVRRNPLRVCLLYRLNWPCIGAGTNIIIFRE